MYSTGITPINILRGPFEWPTYNLKYQLLTTVAQTVQKGHTNVSDPIELRSTRSPSLFPYIFYRTLSYTSSFLGKIIINLRLCFTIRGRHLWKIVRFNTY